MNYLWCTLACVILYLPNNNYSCLILSKKKKETFLHLVYSKYVTWKPRSHVNPLRDVHALLSFLRAATDRARRESGARCIKGL